MSFEKYAALLPKPQIIQRDYGLDTTTVLTLHRPLLARIQPPALSGNEEEDGEIDAPKPMDTDAQTAGELLDAWRLRILKAPPLWTAMHVEVEYLSKVQQLDRRVVAFSLAMH